MNYKIWHKDKMNSLITIPYFWFVFFSYLAALILLYVGLLYRILSSFYKNSKKK